MDFIISIRDYLLTYLKEMHLLLEVPGQFQKSDWDRTINPHPTFYLPRQGNRIDCGVFVCMYIDFINNECEPNFTQENIIRGMWRKKMMLLMIPFSSYDVVDEHIARKDAAQVHGGMVFSKEAIYIISKNPDYSIHLSDNCDENSGMNCECDNNCLGKDGCSNKSIQQNRLKKVIAKHAEGMGRGLFADKEIKDDEFIIEYTGEIVTEQPENEFVMKYPGLFLRIDPDKTDCLAKFVNHSCNPNCYLDMRIVNSIPRMCLFTKKDIDNGEQLTFSYGCTLPVRTKAELMKKGTKCLCGTSVCLRVIEKPIYVTKFD